MTTVTVRLVGESGEPWTSELSARVAESTDQGYCDETPSRKIQPDSSGAVSVPVYWSNRRDGEPTFLLLHFRHEVDGTSRHWVSTQIPRSDSESLDLGAIGIGDTTFASAKVIDPLLSSYPTSR